MAAGFALISTVPLTGNLNTAWTPLILGRRPTALGQGLTGPGLNALISRVAEDGRQGMTLGLSQGIGSPARAVAPPMGRFLFDLSPQWPYWIGAGILVVLGVFVVYIARLRRAVWVNRRGWRPTRSRRAAAVTGA